MKIQLTDEAEKSKMLLREYDFKIGMNKSRVTLPSGFHCETYQAALYTLNSHNNQIICKVLIS